MCVVGKDAEIRGGLRIPASFCLFWGFYIETKIKMGVDRKMDEKTGTLRKQRGRASVVFENPPLIMAAASTVGKKEGDGPLGVFFDRVELDPMLGKKSWEEAESELQSRTAGLVIEKSGLSKEEIRYSFAGDLLAQLIATSFGNINLEIPMFGLYGACSTMGEGLGLGAMCVEGGFADHVLVGASSHFASAEKQFRFPLEYGNQRPYSATWTVTGCGAVIVSSGDCRGKEAPLAKITAVTTGKIVDMDFHDSMNMGAAMAPEDVNLDPYIFRCAERCVLQKIRYYHNHSLVFPLERTETENRQSHLIPYLTSSGILSAQMFFLSKHRR